MPIMQRTHLAESVQELSFLWLEITPKCNLECVHCYADSGPRWPVRGQMTTEAWCRIITDAAALGCREIQFIGGEPTLHPDLTSMIACAAARGYAFIEVYTNATRLDARLLSTFTDYGVHVAVSFYSDSPDIHDAITKSAGGFHRTTVNIKRMVSAGVPVRAGIIQMRENRDSVAGARILLQRLGVKDVKVDIRREVGRGVTTLGPNDPMAALCGECWKGRLCVTSTGQMFPCVFSRFADVGCATDGISNVLQGASLLNFRAGFRDYCERRQAGAENSTNAALNSGRDPLDSSQCREDTCRPSCSPCGPEDFIECGPGGTRCSPDFRGCEPLAKCVPAQGPCGPRSTCRPSSDQD